MRPRSADTSEPGLREAEDVVDEEQHVLALVAEVLGDGEAGEADAGAGARRLVHLAVDEGAFRAFGRAAMLLRVLVDARFDHLVIEVVALAGALADAGEDRVAAVGLGDVVDELHDQHGLADAGAAEEADLAALGVRREEVDDLDAGDEDLRLGRLLGIARRRLVDGPSRLGRDRARLVDRLADDVDDAPERAEADRHRDRLSRVAHLLAPREALGGVHGDAAHGRFAELLGHLEDETVALVLGLERVQDLGQMAVELHVDDGADHLRDAAGGVGAGLPGGRAGHGELSHRILVVVVFVRAPRRPR